MCKEYENKTLKKLQGIELFILKDFIAIAEKHNIEYFAIGGTAIGALRHKGFIPWDDDIDLCISREGYEKLATVIKQEYSDKYEMLSARENQNYPILEGHLQLKDTKFVDKAFKHINCNMGIFLDFFIYDNISDDKRAAKKQIFEATFWGKFLILKCIPFPVIPFKGFVATVVHGCTGLIHLILKILPVSNKKLYDKITQASTRYNNTRTKYVTLFRDLRIEQHKMLRDDIYPLKKIMFEDVKLFAPRNIEKILNNYYGDYMKIPAKTEQVNHAPIKLDFGSY